MSTWAMIRIRRNRPPGHCSLLPRPRSEDPAPWDTRGNGPARPLRGSDARCGREAEQVNEAHAAVDQPGRRASHLLEVLGVATRLGLTSFGGPVAHLGYFREEYVVRRRWVDEATYADLVALCQFLPGPASSQVGIAIGVTRGGLLGGLTAWLGFTLPSALALVAFAY